MRTAVKDQATPTFLSAADAVMLALIIGFGALQLVFVQRGAQFYTGDTTYLELARSIVQQHSYDFNFRHETMIPPGFPAILALLSLILGFSHETLVRVAIVSSGTLAYLVSYQMIRRVEGRAAAAVICLLFMSSPTLFQFSTRLVLSDVPYFFTSMVTLTAAITLDRADSRRSQTFLTWLCGGAMVASALIRSAGIMLCAGLLAWLTVSLLANRTVGLERLRKFRGVLIAGLLVQALWMVWTAKMRPEPEWPIGGYPLPYLAQLKVKSGNQPELGSATFVDVAERFERNLADRTAHLVSFATRKYFSPDWFGPWVLLPLLLVLVGLWRSLWPAGGQLHDWYFVGHEAMYLFWPWDFESRFLLPVAPLAGLYAWRGGRACAGWARQHPRTVTTGALAMAAVCAGLPIVQGSAVADQLRVVFLPAMRVTTVAALGWLSLASAAAWFWWPRQSPASARRLTQTFSWRGLSFNGIQAAGVLAVAALVVVGVWREVQIGRENLSFDESRDREYPEIAAANWLRLHTPPGSVIMARQMDLVNHYSERKVVWFPPISNPSVLMKGIRKHQVEFILVYDRGADSYWKPPERECFERLMSAYPNAFRVVQEGRDEEIFEVVAPFVAHVWTLIKYPERQTSRSLHAHHHRHRHTEEARRIYAA